MSKILSRRPYLYILLYLGLILLFAFLFWLIRYEFSSPPRTFWGMLYFSVVTITTLGYGDIYPTGAAGRVLVSIEAVLGLVMIGFAVNSILDSRLQKEHLARSKIAYRQLARIFDRQHKFLFDLFVAVSTEVPSKHRDSRFWFSPDDFGTHFEALDLNKSRYGPELFPHTWREHLATRFDLFRLDIAGAISQYGSEIESEMLDYLEKLGADPFGFFCRSLVTTGQMALTLTGKLPQGIRDSASDYIALMQNTLDHRQGI